MVTKDKRYTITLERIGVATLHTVRFCGYKLDACTSRSDAERVAEQAEQRPVDPDNEWDLLARVGNVLWLKRAQGKAGMVHRVAYGGDIKEFGGGVADVYAAHRFGESVLHELTANGELEH